MDFQAKVEEFKVQARELVDRVRDLIHEGNIRRIIIRDERGKHVRRDSRQHRRRGRDRRPAAGSPGNARGAGGPLHRRGSSARGRIPPQSRPLPDRQPRQPPGIPPNPWRSALCYALPGDSTLAPTHAGRRGRRSRAEVPARHPELGVFGPIPDPSARESGVGALMPRARSPVGGTPTTRIPRPPEPAWGFTASTTGSISPSSTAATAPTPTATSIAPRTRPSSGRTRSTCAATSAWSNRC